MAVENGTLGKIYYNGIRLAYVKTNNIGLNTAMRETSSKDSYGWREVKPGQISFKFDCEGLFAQQCENMLAWSEDFTNAAWVKSGITVTKNNADGPFGTYSADTLSAINNADYITQDIGILEVFTDYVFSIYMKAASAGTITMQLGDDSGFTTEQKSVTTGWNRFYITLNSGASSAGSYVQLLSDTGDTLTSVQVFGAMLEVGTVPSAYKPSAQLFMDMVAHQKNGDALQLIFTNEQSGGKQFRCENTFISAESLKTGVQDNATFTCSIEGSGELIIEIYS